MSKINKHGLKRDIPEPVKRQVRINSKFACIVPNCRESIYEYEHLIPGFNDATSHDPNKICLTCAKHNPLNKGKLGNEYYSKEQLIEFYNLIRTSEILPSPPKNKDFFNYFGNPVKIQIGDFEFENIESIISIDKENYLSFNKNKDTSPYAPKIVFSGKMENSKGENVFNIIDNEWISNYNHYDLITTNGKIKIYEESQKCIFEALKIPNENKIIITKLRLIKKPFIIEVDKTDFVVKQKLDNEHQWIEVRFKSHISHQKIGISLDSSKRIELDKIGFKLDGNLGNQIIGTGISLGVGSGITRTQNIRIEFVDSKNKSRFLLTEFDVKKYIEFLERKKTIK
jgi:hypothetical protein